jgi:hypothetical protein
MALTGQAFSQAPHILHFDRSHSGMTFDRAMELVLKFRIQGRRSRQHLAVVGRIMFTQSFV